MSCHILSDAEGSRLPEPAALRAMETGTAPAKENPARCFGKYYVPQQAGLQCAELCTLYFIYCLSLAPLAALQQSQLSAPQASLIHRLLENAVKHPSTTKPHPTTIRKQLGSSFLRHQFRGCRYSKLERGIIALPAPPLPCPSPRSSSVSNARGSKRHQSSFYVRPTSVGFTAHAARLTSLTEFDASQKRHRSGTWAYQRREPTAEPVRADKPVIHVSRPEDASPPTKKHQGVRHSLDSTVAGQSASGEAVAGHSPGQPALAEPRRFRVSRSATLSAGKSQVQNAGVSKRDRYAPAVFVEGTRRKKLARKSLAVLHETAAQPMTAPPSTDGPTGDVQQKDLKRPGVKKKATAGSQKDGPTHRPLPESIRNRQHGNMDKIAADMDRWVLDEIGANLHGMEQDKQLAQKPRFKPKAPAKRFHERHPEFAQTSHTQVGESTDVTMTDASDDDAEEDDDDWVIEEYVRVPALTISMDVPATDIGVLDLADDEDSALLFGPLPEDDDDADEEDEDENGKSSCGMRA